MSAVNVRVTLNCQLPAAAALTRALPPSPSLLSSLSPTASVVLSPALLILDAQVTSIANCILYAIALCVFYRQTDSRTKQQQQQRHQQHRVSAAPANCFVLCSRQATARFAWFLFGSVQFWVEIGYAHGTCCTRACQLACFSSSSPVSCSSSSALASALRSISLELYEKLPSKLSILYAQCPIKIVPSHD